jgi:hypothetical protein
MLKRSSTFSSARSVRGRVGLRRVETAGTTLDYGEGIIRTVSGRATARWFRRGV